MMNTMRIQEHRGLRLVREKESMEEDPAALLVRHLRSAGGYDEALLASTPASAMGQAIALARAYGKAKHGRDCTRVLVLTHRDFDLWLANAEGCSRVEPQDWRSFGKRLDGTVCAVVFSFWEPGQAPLSRSDIKELFCLCRSAGVLLLSDERALGLGRTGSLLAWESYGKRPDMTVTALGGGLGGCLLRGGLEAAPGEAPAPEACAQALADLTALLTPGALAGAADRGRYLRRTLSLLPGVTKVEGLGLALSAALDGPAAARLADLALPALTLMVRPNGVLLTPDLAAGMGELAQSLALLRRILAGE